MTRRGVPFQPPSVTKSNTPRREWLPARSTVVASMKIEIWSDVACPWCYIGKRRFETALADFPHRDSVEVTWRSYQLDPSLPEHYDGTELEYLSRRKGMAPAQVAQMFEHVAARRPRARASTTASTQVVVANSFTAHRLIHLAARARPAGCREGTPAQRPLRARQGHRQPGVPHGTGPGAGLDAAAVEELFTTDKYADAVRFDFEEARALGITGVPFFVIDRKFGLSGAQPAETFTAALDAGLAGEPTRWCWSTPRTAKPAARTAAPSSLQWRPALLTHRDKVSVCPGFRRRPTPPNAPRRSAAS